MYILTEIVVYLKSELTLRKHLLPAKKQILKRYKKLQQRN